MNILLLYPEFPDTFWSMKHALKFIQKRAACPPLGLITVAAMLPKQWNKRLVDLNVRKLRDKDIAWADWVFISAMSIQREAARRLIARCKAAGVKVAAGGPIFASEHEQFPEVDCFILNEAELSLPPFLADLEKGSVKPLYTTNEFPDVRQSPIPMWELLDKTRYASMSVQFSRGCPFQCDFCNVTALFGHRPRTKTPAQMIAEIDSLYAQGWRDSVFFVDDNFIGNARNLKTELLPALIEWRKGKSGMAFYTEASINLADDDELLGLMVKAGFDTVFVGIETPDTDCLTECNKKQNRNRDLISDVKRIQRAGLQVQGGFIVGFDSDTPSIFQRQIDFIQKSGITTAMVGLLNAPPGTKLFARMKSENRIASEATGDNVDGTTNIVPAMSGNDLRDGYNKILRHIYEPKHYYRRVRTFLREYKPAKIKGSVRFSRIMGFLRSIFRLGIVGRERYQYWKLLVWICFRRPGSFRVGIEQAIYGYHFRKVAARTVRNVRATEKAIN